MKHLSLSKYYYHYLSETPCKMSARTNSSRTGAGAQSGEGGSVKTGRSKQEKLVLLGDQGVGKSSLALRFVRGEFHENHEATIGGE